MKKNRIVALGMAAMLALGIGSANALSFDQTPIPARQTNTVCVTGNSWEMKSERSKANRIYVRHYLWSSIPGYYGASHHTNYFQAIPSYATTTRLGGNWMAPDSAEYIRSNSIQKGNFYGAGARANTKYADDGFATIMISGYMDPSN